MLGKNMMKQMQEMQKKMQDSMATMQVELAKIECEGTAAGGKGQRPSRYLVHQD